MRVYSTCDPGDKKLAQTDDEGTTLRSALNYAGRGWAVFPLHTIRAGRCSCGDPECRSLGKHPRTPHGFSDASTNGALISRWWATGDSNVGIATGSTSGILVLDVDVQHGGSDSLADIERQYGPLPETVEVITGGGGRHLYFRYPNVAVLSSAGKLGRGLDVRGESAYVVAPPSLHASGRLYVWEAAHHPDDMPLADPPLWLGKLLVRMPECGRDSDPSPAWRQLLSPISKGTRNATLTSIAGWLRLYHPRGVVQALLMDVNLAQCQPPLEEGEVSRIVRSVFRYDQPGVNGHPKAALPRLSFPK